MENNSTHILQNFILVHYGEIALKGKNRSFFESRLVQNIKNQLEVFAPVSFDEACPHTKKQTANTPNNKTASQQNQADFGVGVKNIFGGILIKLNKNGIKNKAKIEDALAEV